MKRILTLILLGFLAIVLGGLVGTLSAFFLEFIDWGQHQLWEVLSVDLPLQTLIICTFGGILLGLFQRYLGNHPKGMNEAMAEIRETGRLDYKHLPSGMLSAATSLIFGASLGPEAAIVGLTGGLGTWAGDVMRSFRNRFGLTESQKSKNKVMNLIKKWPTALAFLAGGVTLIMLIGDQYSGGFIDLSAYSFQWTDLLWSVPLGLVGASGGWLYLKLLDWTKNWVSPIKQKPVLLGTLGGVILGFTALSLPMVLFSGQHLMDPLLEQAEILGFWVLLFTGLARLFLTSFMLNTGWKGGQFMPIIFAGAALGLSVSMLVPSIPAATAMLAVIGALLAVVLPNPVVALVLMALMFSPGYVGVWVVTSGVVMLIKFVAKQVSMSKIQTPEAIVVNN